MSLFSSAFLEEVKRGISTHGKPIVYPVLTLQLPSGTRRYSSLGSPLAADAKVVSWGSIQRSYDLRGPNIQSIEVSPTIEDVDRVFSAEVARYRRSLRGSGAIIQLVSPNVDQADWCTVFSGVLESQAMEGSFTWRLVLRPDDRVLQFNQIPRAAILPLDWSDAPSDNELNPYGLFIPIIYGIHNSDGITDAGMVPAYYVDTVGFRYILGIGKLKAVTAVYVDGAVTSPGNYAITYPIVNGKQVTLIDFTADQATASITADVEGLTDDGETTGNLISNPARQLEHALNNFVWGNWMSGPYLSGAPLNADSFSLAEEFLDTMGHEGSRWIGGTEQVLALHFLEEWLDSTEFRGFWTNAGELALAVNDHRTTSIYPETVLFGNEDEQADSALAVPYDTQSLIQEVVIQYVFGQVAGKFHQSVTVQDLSVTDPVSRGRQLPWSASRVL